MPELNYKIIRNLFRLKSSNKFHKELNLISWDGREPVYDLRGWNEDRTQMTKGVTFTASEYEELINKIKED